MKIDTIIDSYGDYKECGAWGTVNTETGETMKSGKMVSRTVKVRLANGTVSLESEWITDEEMEQEKKEINQ